MKSQSYSRRKFILLLGGLLIAGVVYSPKTVSSAEKTYTAFARCSETGKTGKATNKYKMMARSKAVKACVKNGGVRGCCSVQWVRGPDGKKLKK